MEKTYSDTIYLLRPRGDFSKETLEKRIEVLKNLFDSTDYEITIKNDWYIGDKKYKFVFEANKVV